MPAICARPAWCRTQWVPSHKHLAKPNVALTAESYEESATQRACEQAECEEDECEYDEGAREAKVWQCRARSCGSRQQRSRPTQRKTQGKNRQQHAPFQAQGNELPRYKENGDCRCKSRGSAKEYNWQGRRAVRLLLQQILERFLCTGFPVG